MSTEIESPFKDSTRPSPGSRFNSTSSPISGVPPAATVAAFASTATTSAFAHTSAAVASSAHAPAHDQVATTFSIPAEATLRATANEAPVLTAVVSNGPASVVLQVPNFKTAQQIVFELDLAG